jgi:uncharacterized membrane protein
MAKGTVHLCVGIYDRLETAEQDYADLNKLHHAGLVGAYDAAVVVREADGTVRVADRKKESARGAWTGLGIGALAGLLFPPALIGTALVGGVAGGLVGKAKEGLSMADAEELGAALREHEVALAVVGDAALLERVDQVLAGATRRIAKELDLTKEDLAEAMAQAEQAG